MKTFTEYITESMAELRRRNGDFAEDENLLNAHMMGSLGHYEYCYDRGLDAVLAVIEDIASWEAD